MTNAKTSPHVAMANAYAADVLSGTILACKWIRLACERHQRDIERSKSKEWPYRFDDAKAERICKFTELLPHVKGKWGALANPQRLIMEPWQCFLLCSLFGWVHKVTEKRRFRKARLYVPRKNGKSCLAAPIGLFMLTKDDEPGAEVYSGATNEKQAWEVFRPAKEMLRRTPALIQAAGVEINAKTLIRVADQSKFEPIIGKPGDGSSPHCAIIDEYHEHDTDDQLSTMETGMGARDQPISLIISTAGDNLAGPCYDDWDTCRKILERIIDDDRTFCLIYTIDPDVDWTSETALRMANPNYGVSIDPEYLQANQRDAINNPRKQGHFKTKHLNLWVQARDAFINMQKWEECRDPSLTLEAYKGRRCWMGMDLASKIDLTALELVFEHLTKPGEFVRFGKYYLPESTVNEADNANARSYQAWQNMGWLTVTDGNQTDYFHVLDDIKALASEFEIAEIAFDPHNATMLVTALQAEGLPMVEFGPTVLNFSEPMKQVEALIRDRKLHHNGDPVMQWAMSNVVAKLDRKDNIYPNKERPEKKIDPFIALCAAIGRIMVRPEPTEFRVFLI